MKDFIIKDGSLFSGGDIRVGDCERQNQSLLIMCPKGSFKQFPATCVGAADFLESEDSAAFLREVRNQFTADGMTVDRLVMVNNKLRVDAHY